MAEKVDYAALKKGGFMRQKQKGCFSLRLAVVGGNLTAENIKAVAEVAEKSGYGDYRVFTKVFNKSEGITPSQYRRDFLEETGTG